MASFRRTLSPYQDRQYQNEAVQYVEPLLNSHRLGKPSENSMLSTVLGVNVRRLLAAFLPGKSPRKTWRRWLTRCLLCFLLGSLLGMTQFGYENDLQAHDFSFEIKPPYVNAQLEDRPDEVLVRQNDLMLQNPYLEVGENSSLGSTHREDLEYMPVKQLIVITPTYNRALQAYFLNRIGQLLRLVKPPLLWIVVEMNAASMETAEILRKSGVIYQHLVCKKNMTNVKDRGVHQRNTALEHIELHRLDGIVYFADDDNIYSTELLENLRQISRFGTWPTAMLASFKNKAILEGPVCNGSQVIGWHTNEKSKRLRRFHVDMSGFAFNSTILWDPKIWRWPTRNPIRQLDTVKEGFQETTFIEQLVEDESQMEALPPTCLMILNWHLHLDAQDLNYPKGWLLQKNLEAVLPIE